MSNNADQPAYPNVNNNKENRGLTKRELIAAMAMHGILANGAMMEEQVKGEKTLKGIADAIAKDSIICADAILSQL